MFNKPCTPLIADSQTLSGVRLSRGMAVCQKPLCLERLESDTSAFSASLDHYDLQDNTDELDVDRCDAKLWGWCLFHCILL